MLMHQPVPKARLPPCLYIKGGVFENGKKLLDGDNGKGKLERAKKENWKEQKRKATAQKGRLIHP